jgi:hypothetical protein
MANRDSVLSGKTVTLRAIFTDENGDFVAPDDDPQVYIYAPGSDTSLIQDEADADTWDTAYAGPISPTEVVPGLYELTYTVPAGWEAGTAIDAWVAEFSNNRDVTFLTFIVTTEVEAFANQLAKNLVLIVELMSGIQSLDNLKQIPSTTTFSWTTELSPFCVSVEMVQMTLGPWIEWIPADTLALMIHVSSKLASFLTPPKICDPEWYRYAKAQFVIYDIALKAFTMPTAKGTGSYTSGRKRLGDLTIDGGGSSASGAVLSSGIDLETIKDIKRIRQEWLTVINSGACLLPGQSPPPAFAIPGWHAPGRFVNGRLWEETSNYYYSQTSSNEKHLRPGHVRSRHGFTDRGPGGGLSGAQRWGRW